MGKVDMILDRVFKAGILIIGFALLLLFYTSTDNQRYSYVRVQHEDTQAIIFDSKTGATYALVSGNKEKAEAPQWIKFSPFIKPEYLMINK
jgi:hypothetical protein